VGLGRKDRNQFGWPNKVLPYEIHEAAFPPGSTAQKAIRDAVKEWNDKSAVRLSPRQEEEDYVVFTPDPTACSCHVGRKGGEQHISCALAGDPIAAQRAGVGIAKQTDDLLTAVAVNQNGGLSVSWVEDTGGWDGPVHIGGLFRTDAWVALAQQTDDVLTALAISKEGALNAAWVVGTGEWEDPVPFGPARFLSGAPVAMAKDTDDILTAVAVDRQGFMNVAWVEETRKWNDPVQFGPARFPTDLPVGVALAKQSDDVMTALAVDNDGALNVAWKEKGGQWQGPVPFGLPSFFRGAPVALEKQADDILTAAVIDKDGRLNVARAVGMGKWGDPVPIGDRFRTDGATAVCMAKQTDDVLVALAVDSGGQLNVASVVGTEEWTSPQPFGPANLPPGAPVAAAKQTDDILTAITVFDNGALGIAWVVGTEKWNGPAPFRSGAFSKGNLMHEIGHAVGLFHEHQRSDRAGFIMVKTANIEPSKLSDFDIVNGELSLGTYDCGSIMHYDGTAFGRPGPTGARMTTITITNAAQCSGIGQRKALSSGDIAAVKSLYP
jgi:hypothetical protein